MNVESDPRNPGAKALCGSFAVQQNASNRSSAVLNDAMDNTFSPVHVEWSNCWARQVRAEALVTEAVHDRDQVGLELEEATRSVLSALQATQGRRSPLLKQYIPGGDLAIVDRPFARQLSEMATFAPVIAGADDAVIPPAVRERFTNAFAAAKEVQARLDGGHHAAVEAQRARRALDRRWTEAYKEYHRAVEFVSKGDRGLIKTWIRQWPEPAYAAKPQGEEP